jgi:hypothetical protein
VTFEATQVPPPLGAFALPMAIPTGGLAMPVGRFAPMEAAAATAVSHPVLAPYQNTPDVEARAAHEFTQGASADLIRKLYQYLEANAPQHPQLAECIPLVARAAELYGARDYPTALSQAYQAYRAITIQRSGVPTLPSLE